MSGLIRRLLGLNKQEVERDVFHKGTMRSGEEEFEEEPQQKNSKNPGEYSVPNPLKEDGFYAIQISQGEMYDLGNFDFIPHFILYDRKSRVAIDVTSDVKPAPLLSETLPAEVLSLESVGNIEKYLIGEKMPEYSVDIETGVKRFVARELDDPCLNGVRQRMVELRDARLLLDSAVNALREETVRFKAKYLPAPANQ